MEELDRLFLKSPENKNKKRKDTRLTPRNTEPRKSSGDGGSAGD